MALFVIAVYSDKCDIFGSRALYPFVPFLFAMVLKGIIILRQMKILMISLNKSWYLLGPNYAPGTELKTSCSFSLIQTVIICGRYYYYPIFHMRKLKLSLPQLHSSLEDFTNKVNCHKVTQLVSGKGWDMNSGSLDAAIIIIIFLNHIMLPICK